MSPAPDAGHQYAGDERTAGRGRSTVVNASFWRAQCQNDAFTPE